MQAYRPATVQNVAIGSSSAATANATQPGVVVVRLLSDTDCYIAIGQTPTATTSSMKLKANVPEYFRIAPERKIAVLQVSASGTLNVTEMVL